MSLLLDINPEPSFAPKTSTPGPERLISSNPVYRCWPQDASRSDKVQTGVWEATPGEHHSIKGTMFEFCHIISGVAEIEEQGGETRTFRAATASP